MSGHPDMNEREISLSEMLDSREQRALMQKKLIAEFKKPLLCFTMNIAGPIKSSELIRHGFRYGDKCIVDTFKSENIEIVYRELFYKDTGCEGYYILNGNALSIKKLCCDIENTSKLGRLYDMDVIKEDASKVSRSELSLPPRKCFICGMDAAACARSRSHSLDDIRSYTQKVLIEAVNDFDSEYISGLSARALLYEVCTTPKPGLVDRANCGSHKDMDMYTFIDSTLSLLPYFRSCFLCGRNTSSCKASETFSAVRRLGKKAELGMFAATNGVNTHKGAIFSMGILCAALGRLPYESWKKPEIILSACADMTKGLVEKDFKKLEAGSAVTAGQKLYLKYGITGIRGQIEAGLPAVLRSGLPTLKKGISKGLGLERSGCAALLSIMTDAIDTNIIARSSISIYNEVICLVKSTLEESEFPSTEQLKKLDDFFIQKNLSPGGSADLLAVTYLLFFLENGEFY